MNTQNNNLDASNFLPLCSNTCFGQVRYIYSPTTGSTNDDARKLAADGAPHGTLIVTDNQTAGRGRHNRHWDSPPNCGIYASLLLRPERPIQHAPLLGIAAGIAIAEAIQTVTGTSARIKWPNDILLHERKIAGILTETDIQSEKQYTVIIGFGINVNTPYTALPNRVVFPASSIQIETGRHTTRPHLLAAWLQCFEHIYHQWNMGQHAPIITSWHKHAYGLGKTVSIQEQDKATTGILQGIAEDGSLILKGVSGEIIRILSGDITATTFVE